MRPSSARPAAMVRHHIVTTAIEHPSVLEPVAELERRGHAVTIVPPSRSGVVDADAVIAAIRPETRLVAMMLANNETGVIQPVADVGARLPRAIDSHPLRRGAGRGQDRRRRERARRRHARALRAQAARAERHRRALRPPRPRARSRHILGGAQERRRRAGTENVPLAAAFGVAAEIARERAGRRRAARRARTRASARVRHRHQRRGRLRASRTRATSRSAVPTPRGS